MSILWIVIVLMLILYPFMLFSIILRKDWPDKHRKALWVFLWFIGIPTGSFLFVLIGYYIFVIRGTKQQTLSDNLGSYASSSVGNSPTTQEPSTNSKLPPSQN